MEVRNITAADLGFVQIEFTTYDGGKIMAADFAILEPIPRVRARGRRFANYQGWEATAEFQIASIE